MTLRYQRILARSLIAGLGHEAAVAVCRDMLWHGILGWLVNEKTVSADRRRSSALGPALPRLVPMLDTARRNHGEDAMSQHFERVLTPSGAALWRAAGPPRTPILDAVAWAFLRIVLWQARAATRRHLAELPDHLMQDIGLSRQDVLAEASKPFWKV